MQESCKKTINCFEAWVTVNCYVYFRRQKEQEQKIVEEETVKRIEEMVAQRVAEELEKRKDEIEAEVLRRVEEAKQLMERQMLEELERRRKERLEEENRREVSYLVGSSYLPFSHGQRNAEFAINLQLVPDVVATFLKCWRCRYLLSKLLKWKIVNSAVSAHTNMKKSIGDISLPSCILFTNL